MLCELPQPSPWFPPAPPAGLTFQQQLAWRSQQFAAHNAAVRAAAARAHAVCVAKAKAAAVHAAAVHAAAAARVSLPERIVDHLAGFGLLGLFAVGAVIAATAQWRASARATRKN
jgi:hypothetical protein